MAGPDISKETLKRMAEFFLKTSIPRILKTMELEEYERGEENEKQLFRSELREKSQADRMVHQESG